MKKRTLIIATVLTSFSLTAFAYINWSNPATGQEKSFCNKTTASVDDLDLHYGIDSRFINTVTKENVEKAKSIIDILPERATKSIESYQAVKVSILLENNETTEFGLGDVLNNAQKELLQSTGNSTNIFIGADYKTRNNPTGRLENGSLTYSISIIPEKEAEFTSGQDALIEYLKENSREKTAIIQEDKLQPGKVSFTVTKEGSIANVNLTSTSGYTSVDEELVKLISNMPGKWNSATNAKGEKVDQELVFFFGLVGC